MDQFPPPPPPPVPPLPDSVLAPEPTDVPWRAREGVLVAILAFVTGGFFALLLIAVVDPRPGVAGDELRNRLGVVVQMVILGALALWTWLWVKLRHDRRMSSLGFSFKKGDLGAGALAALVGFIASITVTVIVTSIYTALTGNRVTQPEQVSSDALHGGWLVLVGFSVVVLAPLAEELFFRGFLYQALRKWRGVTGGILISAAIFAGAHIVPLLIVGIFPLGVVLAHTFERRGSVVATMIAHAVFNMTGLIILVVAAN